MIELSDKSAFLRNDGNKMFVGFNSGNKKFAKKSDKLKSQKLIKFQKTAKLGNKQSKSKNTSKFHAK